MAITETRKNQLESNLLSIDDFLDHDITFFLGFWAETGHGKSDLILTFPKPIHLLNIEIDGPDYAIRRHVKLGNLKEGDLYIDNVVQSALGNGNTSVYRDEEDDIAVYEYIQDQIENICKNHVNKGGTIAIDTATTWWQDMYPVEMQDIIELREKQDKPLYGFDYTIANKAMKKAIETIRASGLNFVASHKADPIRDNKGKIVSGKFQYVGNNKLPEFMDVWGRLIHDPNYWDGESDPRSRSRRYFIVEKSRLDGDKQGMWINNPSYQVLIDRILDKDDFGDRDEDD